MESFVLNKIAEAQLGNEDGEAPVVDLSGLATKEELDVAKGSLLEAVSKKADQYLPATPISCDGFSTLMALLYRNCLLKLPVGGEERFYLESGWFTINNYEFDVGTLITVKRTQDELGDDYAIIDVEEINRLDEELYSAVKARFTSVINWVDPNTQYPAWRVGGGCEWVNPPMEFGEEYCTTERWRGYPVYIQLVNAGTLLGKNNAKHIAVYYDADENCGVLKSADIVSMTASVQGGTSEWSTMPFITGGTTLGGDAYYMDGQGLVFRSSGADLSKFTGKAIFKYTKEYA